MKMLILPLLVQLTVKVSGKCHISPLSTEYKITSDTIGSGTVKSFYMRESGGAFAGKVMVRRVFRGDKGLEGRMVMVEGFGSKHVCLSALRLGDTKLFFLKKIKQKQQNRPLVPQFKLTGNIIKLNLRNLKTLLKLEDQNKSGKTKILGTDHNVLHLTDKKKKKTQNRFQFCTFSCLAEVNQVCGENGKTVST